MREKCQCLIKCVLKPNLMTGSQGWNGRETNKVRNTLAKSSTTAIRAGTTNRIKNVAMPRPKTIVIAIGIKNCACRLFSKRSGSKPPTVVAEVNIIGRNLSQEAFTIASVIDSDLSLSSTVVANIIEPLIMIPESPIRPIRLKIVRLYPSSQWPIAAPINPIGIIAIMANGRL